MISSASVALAPLGATGGRERERVATRLARSVPRAPPSRLAEGQLREEAGGLEHAAEAEPARRCGPKPARSVPERRCAPARHEAADRVEQGRLAGAVGADEADDLAASDRDRCRRPRTPPKLHDDSRPRAPATVGVATVSRCDGRGRCRGRALAGVGTGSDAIRHEGFACASSRAERARRGSRGGGSAGRRRR